MRFQVVLDIGGINAASFSGLLRESPKGIAFHMEGSAPLRDFNC